ncbi:MAG: FitA-like ribbon-helix-helix domain-containing protein, partial [Gemmatimonadaceae bacterium]
MDTTIRNLDEAVYRAIRTRARKNGMTVGEA